MTVLLSDPPVAAVSVRDTGWLAKHGAAYGLWQMYRNGAWHYEPRPAAIDGGGPSVYADPAEDPRMQQ